ncbi:unnamed protein product [Lactuca saligna]|uniref:Uncharacterized protein n=1 Tax=Lactuca saligna TaxID=75948 RepID=A0AA36EEW8_LACSI|nr:unnamed protein product [Lactuca saligna]
MPGQKIETGHTYIIHDVCMDYYGKRVASTSSDATIKIISVTTNIKTATSHSLTTLTCHNGPVWQVAWAYHKFGSLLASHSDGILLQHILLGDSTTKGIEKFETDLKTMHPSLTECRVLKSKLELSVIQYANGISSEDHTEEPKPKKQSAPTAKIGSNKKLVSKPVSSSDESEFESEASDDSDSSDEEEAPKKPAAVAKNGAAAATKKAK